MPYTVVVLYRRILKMNFYPHTVKQLSMKWYSAASYNSKTAANDGTGVQTNAAVSFFVHVFKSRSRDLMRDTGQRRLIQNIQIYRNNKILKIMPDIACQRQNAPINPR